MWKQARNRYPGDAGFFRDGLILEDSLKDHLKVAYILVKHGKFSYESVKEMTQKERTLFLELLKEEIEKQVNELKNQ